MQEKNFNSGGLMGPVRGDLISWARQQQGLRMREVKARGGPATGYQCEVENGRKRNVHSEILTPWVAILNVNEAFARGQFTRYWRDPDTCRGAASDIGRSILAADTTEWAQMSVQDRVRRLLRLMCTQSKHLTEPIVAYMLELDVSALERLIYQDGPIVEGLIKAVADLTLLEEEEIMRGVSSQRILQLYGETMRLALLKGIPDRELRQAIERW